MVSEAGADAADAVDAGRDGFAALGDAAPAGVGGAGWLGGAAGGGWGAGLPPGCSRTKTSPLFSARTLARWTYQEPPRSTAARSARIRKIRFIDLRRDHSQGKRRRRRGKTSWKLPICEPQLIPSIRVTTARVFRAIKSSRI